MTVEYIIGDCRKVLKTLPDNSINCCVTSPPYFRLRNYNHPNQMGLEKTPDEYVHELVKVFMEVRRVLRDDGTVWLNIGDSYASYRDGKARPDTTRGDDTGTLVPKGSAKNRMASTFKNTGIKHKDLIGIPWRVAFALQADGWYLRQDIIWHKPNPMPESVKDRCTKAHEYIFLLSKSQRYYFDAESISEPVTESTVKRLSQPTLEDQVGSYRVPGKTNGAMKAVQPRFKNLMENGQTNHSMHLKRLDGEEYTSSTRNKRSVWTIPTMPYKGAHFATFPTQLIEPCILAGCPVGGTVLDPFGGSGTVGECCRLNQRNAILIELNQEYEPLIRQRTGSEIPELDTFEAMQ
jgi:DNA modification methylase